ncbi:hypothetical protein [Flavobacterium sp. DG2-3]|uniref:hypothetical protein n=1 Tax=Flavobacterium sp. DG2-3 TaxID=3068317 RepID=UPI00273D9528|nr:hypothetical protein [Flavobacterium sp. DG2-3]MDP5198042.1 hypothetical protein [Flavobacterium sp. DG2-3]
MTRKKILITIIIIISNLSFVLALYNVFYYKKQSFDITEKTKLNPKTISKISNGDGSWNWNGKEYDFYKEYYFSLTQNEIIDFCKIANSSNAKYIENIRPEQWLDIYILEENGNKTTFTLKQSNDDEIYFEIDNKI